MADKPKRIAFIPPDPAAEKKRYDARKAMFDAMLLEAKDG